ncbi:hypothetical protein Tco_1338890 [Tanacetum coccineum]
MRWVGIIKDQIFKKKEAEKRRGRQTEEGKTRRKGRKEEEEERRARTRNDSMEGERRQRGEKERIEERNNRIKKQGRRKDRKTGDEEVRQKEKRREREKGGRRKKGTEGEEGRRQGGTGKGEAKEEEEAVRRKGRREKNRSRRQMTGQTNDEKLVVDRRCGTARAAAWRWWQTCVGVMEKWNYEMLIGEEVEISEKEIGESEGSRKGGSILMLMDELVKVGQTMGYNMDGCMKNIEEIIESQGVDVEISIKEDFVFGWHEQSPKISKNNGLITARSLIGRWIIDKGDASSGLFDINVRMLYIDSKSGIKCCAWRRLKKQKSNRQLKATRTQNITMQRALSNEEMKKGIWDCLCVDKAQRPDGNSILFVALHKGCDSSFLTVDSEDYPKQNCEGSKVRGNMSRIKSWDEIVDKMVDRLSKWKMKTLSIGGRLTILKAVLGSMPIYHMSIFKVPMKVLQRMESIRMKKKLGNGADTYFWEDLWQWSQMRFPDVSLKLVDKSEVPIRFAVGGRWISVVHSLRHGFLGSKS